MALDELVHLLRPAEGEPRGALVLLHGRGVDERDLFPLLDALDPERRLVGVAPRGPLTLPPGGSHWYVVRRIGYPDPETFHATFARLTRFVDGVAAATGVGIERTVVGGFSQGAVMSYALALAAGRPTPAGLLALSGFIPTVDGLELDLAGRRELPVAIGHGSHDPVIGVEFGRQARDALEGAGLAVTYRESPMAHSVDPAFLEQLVGWVARVVGEPADAE